MDGEESGGGKDTRRGTRTRIRWETTQCTKGSERSEATTTNQMLNHAVGKVAENVEQQVRPQMTIPKNFETPF